MRVHTHTHTILSYEEQLKMQMSYTSLEVHGSCFILVANT